jgi:hypothetical protein
MQIFIRADKTIALNVDLDNTIADVQQKIFERLKIPAIYQRLVYQCKSLNPQTKIVDNNIISESTLHLLIKHS